MCHQRPHFQKLTTVSEMKKSQSGEVTFPENPMYRGGGLKIVLFRISSLTMTNVFQYASGCTDPTDHPPLTSLTLPHLSSLPLPPQPPSLLLETFSIESIMRGAPPSPAPSRLQTSSSVGGVETGGGGEGKGVVLCGVAVGQS